MPNKDGRMYDGTIDPSSNRIKTGRSLNLGKFIEDISPAIPIVGGIASNILEGINNRKARLYNSPANQVARLREAGLPLAAGSNISAGGGVSTKVNDFGTGGVTQNINAGITRQIDRKKLEIHQQELRAAKAAADLAEGNAKNQLNPSGQFEPTNQGTSVQQTIASAEQAIRGAEIVNKYMPQEKSLSLMKGSQEMQQVAQNIKNLATSNQIQIQDLEIKKILANYQERMSMNELTGLIRRNTGLNIDNQIKRIAYSIEWQTELARITMARNAALASGQTLEAGRLSLLLTNASLPSTQAYYDIRRGMDEATKAKPNLPNTLLYLGMFQPSQSNYNFSQLLPNIPSAGNTYNTNPTVYLPRQN